MSRPVRIVVAGAGVAGAIAARGLAALPGVEVICLERTQEAAHQEAGTGLNVGPNAIRALRTHLPALAATIEAASMPWRRWTIGLTDGTGLVDFDIPEIAGNPGIRIRWAELYRLLREDLPIRYGAEAEGIARQPDGRVTLRCRIDGRETELPDVDIVLAADGRYSRLRETLVGPPKPRHLGVSMYRVLLDCGADCPIDDYGQWFNGPNRLLAFRVPGDQVYCAGAFPIASPDGAIPDHMKSAETLRALYTPPRGTPSPPAAFLIDGLTRRLADIHWARVQEDEAAFQAPGWPILFLGDAAHPMIPTLGQGATMSAEDGCLVTETVRRVLGSGGAPAEMPAAFEACRRDRVDFVMTFSRQASDTMLAGADSVAGTLAKDGAAFRDNLDRLYRDIDGARTGPPKSW